MTPGEPKSRRKPAAFKRRGRAEARRLEPRRVRDDKRFDATMQEAMQCMAKLERSQKQHHRLLRQVLALVVRYVKNGSHN